jgi:RNA polymerase sigma factor (sigma-70 family)
MKPTVLLVDDDALILDSLTLLLQMENIDCAATLDRLSAEAMMSGTFYPVIVADIRLRTMEEGLLLLDGIRRITPDSRVISITGHCTPDLEMVVREHGSSLVLQKSMASTEILAAIEEMLAEIEQMALSQSTLAVEKLYRDVRRLLYSIPQRQYRLTADEAEDVVQEAWLLFLERRARIQNNGSWLAGTVRNLSRRQIDRSRRARETFCSTDDFEDLAQNGKDHSHDDAIALHAALATLDDSTRNLCTLIAIDGYSYDEVSQLTGLPIGSIGPMYLRAKKKMSAAARKKLVVTTSHRSSAAH